MTAKLGTTLITLSVLASLSAGCGEFTRDGRSPSLVVIQSLSAASGAEPDEFGGTLYSDVMSRRTTPAPCSPTSPCPVIWSDLGQVQMTLILKDPGVQGAGSGPTPLNSVTINRYRVEYRRADGRNTPGVDVPFGFDSAITFTVSNDGNATAGFEIVRHAAKQEAPLRALISSGDFISTIARVTFYGRDQAGNDVSVWGDIGIDFGDFADPE